MKTVNSLSAGKSSSYIAKHFPADYNVFALVRTEDIKLLYPDKKLRQMVSDRIGTEFIGTLEMDDVVQIMFDLEQFIGSEIKWVIGDTFEEIIRKHGNYLPNMMVRYCTTDLKMKPIFEWWQQNIGEIVDMRIGYRFGEENRIKKMRKKLSFNGIETFRGVVGKRKSQNKWDDIAWRIPSFPLADNRIKKDMIDAYWVDKPVIFKKGYYNNCVGCFHKHPLLLSMMNRENSNKMKWFEEQEERTGNRFRKEVSYKQINNWQPYAELDFSDFGSCDSGYCGI